MKIRCPNCKRKKPYPVGIEVFSTHERFYLQCIRCHNHFSHIIPIEEEKSSDNSELWFGIIMMVLIALVLSPLYICGLIHGFPIK